MESEEGWRMISGVKKDGELVESEEGWRISGE